MVNADFTLKKIHVISEIKMRKEFPEALQPWYCNNAGMAGKALPNAQCS
jgi:hypothetical protein